MDSTYVYEPLDASKKQIRLLERTPEPNESNTTWSLRIYDTGETPEYRALSYAWGTADDMQPFVLHNGVVMIRQNLAHFFRDVCFQSIGRYFWIDQLCIHQDVIEERNHQVALMADIYKNAFEVIIWLGTVTADTHYVLEMFEHAAASLCHFEKCYDEFPFGIIISSDHGVTRLTNTLLEAIEDVYLRDYWRRLWPVQEVLLARNLTLYIGKHELRWEHFGKLLALLDRMPWQSGIYVMAPPSNLIFLRINGVVESDYCSLLHSFMNHECADPRDKLYALINLLPEASRPSVNYALDVADVYVMAIEMALKSHFHGRGLTESSLDDPVDLCILLGHVMDVLPPAGSSTYRFHSKGFSKQVVRQSWPLDLDPTQAVPEADKTWVIQNVCSNFRNAVYQEPVNAV